MHVLMLSLAYNHYVRNFSTADQALFPSKSWSRGTRTLLAIWLPVWTLWILNEILDGKAGTIHDYFNRYTAFARFVPLFEFGVLLYIAGGYCTDPSSDATCTLSFSSDTNFGSYFWRLFFLNIGQFYVGFKLRDNISSEFDDGKYQAKIANAGCVDKFGNPKQCSVADDQAKWGTICIDGYTYDAMPCSEDGTELLPAGGQGGQAGSGERPAL